ncbi:MAG: sulfatase-like hydrolase/transferase, partial [Verrucomicrobiales bacterium]|nr:sulfatase-like hydrolase/transferase [Verrucomicrobiales bacterium]
DPSERIATSSSLPAGINALTFTVPTTAVPRTTQARFRLSTGGGLGPTGPAADGEVEDHAFVIEASPGPCPPPPADARVRPNIVIILADDLGFGDLGCYGSRDIPTPNIDSLSTNGVRFTSGYVTAPVCSPSRAGLMTGRYQQRFGHETNPGTSLERDPHFGLPVSESTFGDRFRALDYATGWIGKSHLGGVPEFHPLQRGFQEYFGFIESHHDYFDTGEPLEEQHDPILRGTVPVVETNYLTTAFAQECVRFIETHAQHPFLLYAPFNAVHFPLQATTDLLDRAAALSISDPRRRELAPVLLGLDDAVGAILGALRAHHLETNTLIFLTSDNGGTVQLGSVNRPFRGGKTEVYEGGIRVPFLMHWPGHLTPGRVFDAPVSTLDILPTAWSAAGLPAPAGWHLDGVDLLPYLCDASPGVPHPILFWRIETDGLNQGGDVLDGIRAVREGRWKLVKPGVLANWELYDLSVDPGETTDLASARPEVVQHLVAAFRAWSAETARPLWAVDDLDFETPSFVREDIRIGTTGASYLAPQFLPDGSEAAFQDELHALWRGAVDPASGFFASVHGRDQELATGIAPLATAATGPQWGLSAAGTSLYYAKTTPPTPQQIWRVGPLGPIGSAAIAAPLTGDPVEGRVGVLPSQDPTQPSTRLLFGVGQLPAPETAWADEATADLHTTLPEH